MNLRVFWVDLRGGYASNVSFRSEIIDEDTGKEVGFVEARRTPATRHISLFGGKYQGDFTTPDECDAFARGVQAVLTHMISAGEPIVANDEAA